MVLSAVVLPAPFGPMRPTIRPASTSKLTASSARTPRYDLVSARALTISLIIISWCRGPWRTGSGDAAFQKLAWRESEPLHGRVDLGPLFSEEALTLVREQGLACAGTDEHAQTAALLNELLIDEPL